MTKETLKTAAHHTFNIGITLFGATVMTLVFAYQVMPSIVDNISSVLR